MTAPAPHPACTPEDRARWLRWLRDVADAAARGVELTPKARGAALAAKLEWPSPLAGAPNEAVFRAAAELAKAYGLQASTLDRLALAEPLSLTCRRAAELMGAPLTPPMTPMGGR